jgi:hypothetical protein
MGGKRSWLNYKLGCRLGITQPQPQSQSTDFIKQRISLVVTPEQGNSTITTLHQYLLIEIELELELEC